MSVALLAVVVALTIVNLGALVWMWQMHTNARGRDDDFDNTRQDLEELKQEAHNVAMAKILLQTERAVGTDVQVAVTQLTAGFTKQLQGPLLRIAREMESGVSQVLDQHIQTLTRLRDAAVKQMASDASELLGQYRETLTNLRDAALVPLGQINDLAAQERMTLTEHLQAEMKKQEVSLLDKFDNKLSDVISSYLIETLGNDVDLGAQGPYLFRMLEEHKAELRQEIADGA